jgi:hypothetical protein
VPAVQETLQKAGETADTAVEMEMPPSAEASASPSRIAKSGSSIDGANDAEAHGVAMLGGSSIRGANTSPGTNNGHPPRRQAHDGGQRQPQSHIHVHNGAVYARNWQSPRASPSAAAPPLPLTRSNGAASTPPAGPSPRWEAHLQHVGSNSSPTALAHRHRRTHSSEAVHPDRHCITGTLLNFVGDTRAASSPGCLSPRQLSHSSTGEASGPSPRVGARIGAPSGLGRTSNPPAVGALPDARGTCSPRVHRRQRLQVAGEAERSVESLVESLLASSTASRTGTHDGDTATAPRCDCRTSANVSCTQNIQPPLFQNVLGPIYLKKHAIHWN